MSFERWLNLVIAVAAYGGTLVLIFTPTVTFGLALVVCSALVGNAVMHLCRDVELAARNAVAAFSDMPTMFSSDEDIVKFANIGFFSIGVIYVVVGITVFNMVSAFPVLAAMVVFYLLSVAYTTIRVQRQFYRIMGVE